MIIPRVPGSRLHDHFKAAVDQAFAVEGHRVRVRLQTRVGHDLGHALIACLARRPDDPREDHGLVILRFTAMGKDVTLPSGTSSPQHSTSFNAPCSLKTTAAASACF